MGFGPLDALAKVILNTTASHQHGLAVCGHDEPPGTRFDLFHGRPATPPEHRRPGQSLRYTPNHRRGQQLAFAAASPAGPSGPALVATRTLFASVEFSF